MADYTKEVPVPKDVEEALSEFAPLLQQLLYNRGIETDADARTFLSPDYNETLHDPFLLHDMDKAVVRILRAIAEGEKIAIFSDYDCDGIPGAVVLHDFFKKIEYNNFINYIPHRHYEGFGLSVDAIEKLHKDTVALIITIDCGTTSFEAVETANRLGIDVVITDHHEPAHLSSDCATRVLPEAEQSDDRCAGGSKETLPEAIAVVNPKVGDTYPFDGLCGAGVVFKLVEALIQKGKEQKQFAIHEGWEKWLLDMVGVATIADMVPLTGENRTLAKYGLTVLRKSRRPGLQQLLRKQRANQRFLSEDDIGFTIGPRINAASRMDTPEDAFYMLSETDEREAGARVDHLEKLNNERRGIVASMTKELHKRMQDVTEIPDVLVMGNPEWRPSLVGLTANKLAEEYNRPAFLWGRDGNGVIKGSCRSNGVVSVVALMDQIRDSFLEHGGHHMSGGFSVHEDKIHTLAHDLNASFITLGADAAVDATHAVDAHLSLDEVDDRLLRVLTELAPFGMKNPKPLFVFESVVPKEVTLFGKGKEHLKLAFDTDGLAREAIAFFKTADSFARRPEAALPCTLLAHVEQSYFMGRVQTRLRIVEIL